MGAETAMIDRYRSDQYVSCSYDDGAVANFCFRDGSACSLEAIDSIWWRQKPLKVWDLSDEESFVDREFAEREWAFLLRSMFKLAPEKKWLNPLDNHYEWARKPAQLKLASQLGFNVPKCMIGNDKLALMKFFGNADVLYKPLSNFVIPPDRYIFATRVNLGELNEVNVQRAPGIFQQYVQKQFEIRVTVVDRATHWILIDSQKQEKTRTDWRLDQLSDMYEVIAPDERCQGLIQEFMKATGLVYGAFDFIVDPQGVIWFLECNPAGQWLWLEHQTGAAISTDVAGYLFDND